jgi:hypothetical protein
LKRLFIRLMKPRNFRLSFMTILEACAKFGANHAVNKVISFMSVLKNYSVLMPMSGARFATVGPTQQTIVLRKVLVTITVPREDSLMVLLLLKTTLMKSSTSSLKK